LKETVETRQMEGTNYHYQLHSKQGALRKEKKKSDWGVTDQRGKKTGFEKRHGLYERRQEEKNEWGHIHREEEKI